MSQPETPVSQCQSPGVALAIGAAHVADQCFCIGMEMIEMGLSRAARRVKIADPPRQPSSSQAAAEQQTGRQGGYVGFCFYKGQKIRRGRYRPAAQGRLSAKPLPVFSIECLAPVVEPHV